MISPYPALIFFSSSFTQSTIAHRPFFFQHSLTTSYQFPYCSCLSSFSSVLFLFFYSILKSLFCFCTVTYLSLVSHHPSFLFLLSTHLDNFHLCHFPNHVTVYVLSPHSTVSFFIFNVLPSAPSLSDEFFVIILLIVIFTVILNFFSSAFFLLLLNPHHH